MKRLLALTLLLPLSAQAQEQAAQTPQVRALSQKLLAEFQEGINCKALSESLADKVRAAEAEVKALKEKYEPKPDK